MNDENLNHEFKGVWIPASIWLNNDLSLQEKMLLVKIDSFKECFASNQYLADFMGLSVPRVKAIIGNLRKLGFIHGKEERKGNLTIKRTLYVDRIKFHGIARTGSDTKVVLDSIPPRIENNTHSNTVRNKESNTVNKLVVKIKPEFDFKNLGWPEIPDIDLYQDWLTMRKKVKASTSERALKTIGKQLVIAYQNGFTVNECLEAAEAAGWKGFKAEYMNSSNKPNTGQQLATHQPQQSLDDVLNRAF